MSNIVLVNNKRDTKYVYVVDLSTRKFILFEKDKVSSDNNYNKDTDKYLNDSCKVSESKFTLAFRETEHNLLGLLNERDGKLCLAWISEEDFKNSQYEPLVCNLNGNLENISSPDLSILSDKSILSNVRNASARFNQLNSVFTIKDVQGTYYRIKKNEFIERLASKEQTEEPKQSEQTEEPKQSEQTEESKQSEQTEESKQSVENTKDEINNKNNVIKEQSELLNKALDKIKDLFDEKENSIENKMQELVKREKAVEEKEEELLKKSKRLSEILSKLENVGEMNIANTILNVESIHRLSTSTVTDCKPFYMYELILRTVISGDTVSIPKEYFSKLKVFLRKNLEANLDYTIYKALVTLKFSTSSDENIFAVIDNNDNNEFIRITILKEYNTYEVHDNELMVYIDKYNSLRKQAYTIS